MPTALREEFWRRVLAFECGPLTTDLERLTDAGVDVPSPESMADAELTAKLREVISCPSPMRVFVTKPRAMTAIAGCRSRPDERLSRRVSRSSLAETGRVVRVTRTIACKRETLPRAQDRHRNAGPLMP